MSVAGMATPLTYHRPYHAAELVVHNKLTGLMHVPPFSIHVPGKHALSPRITCAKVRLERGYFVSIRGTTWRRRWLNIRGAGWTKDNRADCNVWGEFGSSEKGSGALACLCLFNLTCTVITAYLWPYCCLSPNSSSVRPYNYYTVTNGKAVCDCANWHTF